MNGPGEQEQPRRTTARVAGWVVAIGWTLVLGYLLLWPSDGTTVEDVSGTFGGSDLTDAAGHVVLFLVESAVLHNLLRHYLAPRRALYAALGGALLLGLALEAAQHWIPARGFALLDLGANWSGAAIFAFVYRRRQQ